MAFARAWGASRRGPRATGVEGTDARARSARRRRRRRIAAGGRVIRRAVETSARRARGRRRGDRRDGASRRGRSRNARARARPRGREARARRCTDRAAPHAARSSRPRGSPDGGGSRDGAGRPARGGRDAPGARKDLARAAHGARRPGTVAGTRAGEGALLATRKSADVSKLSPFFARASQMQQPVLEKSLSREERFVPPIAVGTSAHLSRAVIARERCHRRWRRRPRATPASPRSATWRPRADRPAASRPPRPVASGSPSPPGVRPRSARPRRRAPPRLPRRAR